MLKRILTAIVALFVFVPVMIFSDTWAFPILFGLCGLIGTFEMLRCIGIHKHVWISLPLYLVAALTPAFLRAADEYLEDSTLPVMQTALAAVLLAVLYLLAVAVFGHRKVDVTALGTALMMSLYIIGGFGGMVYLCDQRGLAVCLLIFIGAWVTDTFAYFTGRLLGRHKLIPEVSPKKTVEGALGGIIFCAAAYVGYAFLYNHVWAAEGQTLPPLLLGGIGILISVASQVGDLALSQIKRHFGIKDYGNLLPGHGGILDRFDSALAVSILLNLAFGATIR